MPRPPDSHADMAGGAGHSTHTETGAATTGYDSDYARTHQWRTATRELVLAGATVIAAAHQPRSRGSISITLTGRSQSFDLLLAEAGSIALAFLGGPDIRRHPMKVVPIRLDTLSGVPGIRVLARDVTEPTQLRLVVELTARNPHTDTTCVMACEYDSVCLDAQTQLALLDFQRPKKS